MPKGKSSKQGSDHAYGKLQTYDEQVGALRVVIESPRGCQNKYKLNEHTGLFDLHKVLPTGMFFPLDFGYVPSTLADDGDPIDVLMFTDNPTFTGCVARVRLIGVIKAEQRSVSEPDWKKNHRLLAVALVSHTHQHMQTIDDIDPNVLEEIEQFFVTYNKAQGKQFNLLGRGSKEIAEQLVREAMARRAALDARSQTAAKKKAAAVTSVAVGTNVIPLGSRGARFSSSSSSEYEGEDGTTTGADEQSEEFASLPTRKRAKAKKTASGAKRGVKAKKAGPSKRTKKKSTGLTKRTKAKKAAGESKRPKTKKAATAPKRPKVKKPRATKRPKAGAKKASAESKKPIARKGQGGLKKATTKKSAVKKSSAKKIVPKKPAGKKAATKKQGKRK